MIASVLLLFHLLVHPFHVSVADIKYKEDQKAIQISMRMFLDDLELALREYSGIDTLDITDKADWAIVRGNIAPYVLENLQLWDEKDKPYVLNFIGAEIEEDVMWCYIEIEKVKRLERVKIKNSVLTEVWGDQENLIHFRAFDGVQSARLFKGEEIEVFEWKD